MDCTLCGNPISPARLRAVPNATLCIDCQSKHDVAPTTAPVEKPLFGIWPPGLITDMEKDDAFVLYITEGLQPEEDDEKET